MKGRAPKIDEGPSNYFLKILNILNMVKLKFGHKMTFCCKQRNHSAQARTPICKATHMRASALRGPTTGKMNSQDGERLAPDGQGAKTGTVPRRAKRCAC